MSTNSPKRPSFEGEISVFMSPAKVWLADRAERDVRGRLMWAAMPLESPRTAAAISAHLNTADILKRLGPSPEISDETVCSWAANLAAKYATSAKDGNNNQLFSYHAEVDARYLASLQASDAIAKAIQCGIHHDSPFAVAIETMQAIAVRENLTGARAALSSLAVGLDPSGGMFTPAEQLDALKNQFPVLRKTGQYKLGHRAESGAYVFEHHGVFVEAANAFQQIDPQNQPRVFKNNELIMDRDAEKSHEIRFKAKYYEEKFNKWFVAPVPTQSTETHLKQLSACWRAVHGISGPNHGRSYADAGIALEKTDAGVDVKMDGVSVALFSKEPDRRELFNTLVETIQTLATPIAERMNAALRESLQMPEGHHLRFNIIGDIRWIKDNLHRNLSARISPMTPSSSPDQLNAEFRVFLDVPRGHLFMNQGPNMIGKEVNLLKENAEVFHYGNDYEEVIGSMIAAYNAAMPAALRPSQSASESSDLTVASNLLITEADLQLDASHPEAHTFNATHPDMDADDMQQRTTKALRMG
jgi:hypothetical protein